ncbi:MAG TPA: RiPP maturation radical SAM C-methyltransferase [Acidobacteriota bacterium]|nr:RiPP maturation radical SAM C-methyltransferase [Acidobacteriota bacterium]
MKNADKMLRDGDVIIIVPPFGKLTYPSLGAHLLQAIAREQGFTVRVLYANMVLAAEIGIEEYETIYDESLGILLGERFFARLAFGTAPLAHRGGDMCSMARDFGEEKAARVDLDYDERRRVDLDRVKRLEGKLDDWVDRLVSAVVERAYPIVGCTSMFQQISASVALLNRVKSLSPGTLTVLGGANCEGEMAEGMESLQAEVDYIFSGESEETFPRFLKDASDGNRPAGKIVRGSPCRDMDALPLPSFDDYYEQLDFFLGGAVSPQETWVMYETSRGCWWGQKQHCTFCGLNGEGMGFRQKSPEKTIAELETLKSSAPTRNVMMTDNIMPFVYFKTVVPEMAERGLDLNLFYEMKANLSLEKVISLKRAGINSIQPGIEALSSSLLKRMRKGVSARQNVMLLRYGRSSGVNMTWNILWGFPGDQPEDYEETLAVVPLIHHLQPPNAVGHLSVERFSPYFFQPERHGVSNIRPLMAYRDVLPAHAAIEKMGYHFVADYESGGYDRIDLVRAIRQDVEEWKEQWKNEQARPELRIGTYEDQFALIDTRGLEGTEEVRLLDRQEAAFLLTSRRFSGDSRERRAVEEKLALVMDGYFVPLPVADAETVLEFEAEGWKSPMTASAQATPYSGHA